MMEILLESCYQQRFTSNVLLHWWNIQQTWGTQDTDTAQKEQSQSNLAPLLQFHQKLWSSNIILELLKRVSRILLPVILWRDVNGGQTANGGRLEQRKVVSITLCQFQWRLSEWVVSDLKHCKWEEGFCKSALMKLHLVHIPTDKLLKVLEIRKKYLQWSRHSREV